MDTGDDQTVVQGQPMRLDRGGDPSWNYSWDELSLTGRGTAGCHGGSGLSGLGGDIRAGELPAAAPIRHALKIGLNRERGCSRENHGYRWPANKADSGYRDNYGGDDPQVHMGTLLALPPDFDVDSITEPDVRKAAQALKTYGGYVVDSTGGPTTNSVDVQHGFEDQLPDIDSDQMHSVFAKLSVITNNAEQTPGGWSLTAPRTAGCAPAFTDGTGGAPAHCGAAR